MWNNKVNKVNKLKKWSNNNLIINKLKIFGINSICLQILKMHNHLVGTIKIWITSRIKIINSPNKMHNRIYGTWILFLQIILITLIKTFLLNKQLFGI